MEKTIITQEELKKIWRGDYINDETKSGYYKKNDTSTKSGISVIIENILVSENVKIENEEALLAICFKNSEITNLTLNNCKTDFITFTEKSRIGQFNLGQSTSTSYIFFEDSINKSGLNIWTGSKCELIRIEKCDYFRFVKVSDNDSSLETLLVEGSKLASITNENSNIGVINLNKVMIGTFEINGKSTTESIIFSCCIFNDFVIKSGTIDLYIKIDDCKIINFSTQVNFLPEIIINNTFIKSLIYKNLISTTFNLKKCKVVDFVFEEMKTGKDALNQFLDCEISNLRFDKIFNFSSFNLSNLKPLESYSIDTVIEKLTKQLIYIETSNIDKCTTSISMISSDMGKMLISSDLSQFDKFIFYNSKISDIFIAGPKLPKLETLKEEDLILQQRIAYNQIKKIYENRGDAITPLKYFRDEMNAYKEQKIADVEEKSISEKFQLSFNKHSNSHGTNWVKPLYWTFGISIILYVFYCWLLFGISAQFDFNLVPYYFEFLNPTHKINFIKEFDISKNTGKDSIALLFDYLNRIIVPLFIYQMIQAFRMYGKR